jgi:hypothetical protein
MLHGDADTLGRIAIGYGGGNGRGRERWIAAHLCHEPRVLKANFGYSPRDKAM